MPTFYVGNVVEDGKPYRDWFVGHFVEKGGLRTSDQVEVRYRETGEDWSIPAHYCKTATTIVLVLEGENRKRINGVDVVLGPLDYIIIPPKAVVEDLPSPGFKRVVIRVPSIPGDRVAVGEA